MSTSSPDNDHNQTSSFPLVIPRTSGRSKKRTQRRLRWKKERLRQELPKGETIGKLLQQEVVEDEEIDNRTWRTILFPSAHDGDDVPKEPPIRWPRSPQAWYKAFGEAWGLYKGTWEGFFSKTPNDDDATTAEKQNDDETDDTHKGESAAKQIADNASNNLRVAQEEGGKLLEEVQSKTGIYTVEDVKQTAREMMKVATAMLKEFMTGYRKGRDEEVDKMLHEYFQEEEDDKKEEEEEETTKRPKRRKKRRIPSSLSG